MRLFFFTIIGIFKCYDATAQEFYLIDTLSNSSGHLQTRKVIDLNTCAINFNTTVGLPYGGIPIFPPDMTITGEGGVGIPVALMFSLGNRDMIPDNVIVNNFFVPIASPSIGPPFAPETSPKGISTDYNHRSYLVGNGLTAVDGIAQTTTYLGNLSPAFRPRGQMTFREGSFYYPSVSHELIQLKVGAGNDYYLRSVGPLPDTLNYGGLFSIPYSCDSTTTYLIHHDPLRGSTIFVLDIPSLTLTEQCQTPFKSISAAYDGENTLPPCNWALDLATLDPSTIHRYDTICAGTLALLDTNISLLPLLEIDSITIEIRNPLDGSQESLSVSTAQPDVNTSPNGSHRLTLSSTGFTKSDALLSVLASLAYTNDALAPSVGERTLLVTAHHPYYGTQSAKIYLEVSAGTLAAAVAQADPTCYGFSDGTITLDISGGQQPYQVGWSDGSQTTTDRQGLGAGAYAYRIADAAQCRIGDTLTLVQPDTLVLRISAAQDTICGHTGSLVALAQGGTPAYTYAWSSGGNGNTANNLTASTYQLSLTDANGCVAGAAYTLVAADTIFAALSQAGCQGSPITLAGQSYTQDTSFRQAFLSVNGCDSILDVQLRFYETYYSATEFSICPGEALSLYGSLLSRDTSFEVLFQSVNGCDSIEQYRITLLAAPVTNLSASRCAGESYLFAGNTLRNSGTYTDTLLAVSGCDSLVQLQLTVHPLPIPQFITMGSLCADGSAVLGVASNFATYAWNTGLTTAELDVTTPGDYGLTVTDANGCAGSAAISLTDLPPVVAYALEQPACPAGVGRVLITAIDGGIPPFRLAQNGQVVAVGDYLTDFAPGSYALTLLDANDCADELAFTITPASSLSVFLPTAQTIDLGESTLIALSTSFQPSSIAWSPPTGLACTDCLTPLAAPTETTRYFLALADNRGCTWNGSTLVKVVVKGLYIPNAFSPNNDNNNDTFQLFPSTSVQTVGEVAIFDRWGAQVFQANGLTPAWDGRIKGENAPTGMYVYRVSWVDVAGNVQVNAGEVLLLR